MKRTDSILHSLFSSVFSRRGLFHSSTLRLFDSRDHRPGLFDSSTLRLFDSRDRRPGLFDSSTLRLFDSRDRRPGLFDSSTLRLFDSSSGSALVIVLGLLSVLMLMGVAFAVTMRTERQGASNMRHAAMARHTLDSAIARTMSDLDAELASYHDDVPDEMVVLASPAPSNDEGSSISLVSHSLARHLPTDQKVAALYTKAYWRPIRGGIRVSDRVNNNPTADDAPLGRYAYVVLNNNGCLDPNVVARENERGFGLSAREIQPGAGEHGRSGKLLGVDANRTVTEFITQRNKDGHYASMRDFLRESVTNKVYQSTIQAEKETFPVSTNSFTVGSMALDDLTPPVLSSAGDKLSQGEIPYRIPKVCLGDATLPDVADVAKAFAGAFDGTWEESDNSADALPDYFPYKGKGKNECPGFEQVAARLLLDWLDDDILPGGSTHRTSETGSDDYLPAYEWCQFPCVEPIPMLDNMIAIGSLDFKGFARQKVTNENGELVDGPATSAVWKVEVKMPRNSSFRYVGWTVPDAAVGEYKSEWEFAVDESDDSEDAVVPASADNSFKEKFFEFLGGLQGNLAGKKLSGTMKVTKGIPGNTRQRRGDFDDEHESNDYQVMVSFELSMSMSMLPLADRENPDASKPEHTRYVAIPDEFGIPLMARGRVFKGSDLLQIAPAPRKGESDGPDIANYLSLPLVFRKKDLYDHTNRKSQEAFLGGVFCLDPMFAYRNECWIPSLGFGESDAGPTGELRKRIVSDEKAVQDILTSGAANPLTKLYLSDPYQQFGGKALFQILSDSSVNAIVGGGSDVMWANPSGVLGDDEKGADDAALAFYIDPSEANDDEPECFSRIGQLGFLPIGTYRTIALLDGFCNGKRVPRQRVLDYFTMYPLREKGSSGTESKPGSPVKTALFPTNVYGRIISSININPPRTIRWKAGGGGVEFDDYNMLPMTAALMDCPLREWAEGENQKRLDWETASLLAEAFASAIDRDDEHVKNEDILNDWNCDGVAHDIGVLGRCGRFLSNPSESELKNEDPSWDSILRQETKAVCDFDREGVVRNSAGMFTARQQLFTILIKADSFTLLGDYSGDSLDASHGTSLASVEAIVHVWRDPDPLRDAAGYPVLDKAGNPIHPYVVLDVYQF